jgi:RNA polymerase sigma-70 factor, ECF subfamily
MSGDRSDLDDNRLISLATQGDKKAFGVLYERYVSEIYRYAFYRLGNQQDAEDITANAFIKTWEYLPKIYERDGSIRNFRNWLYRVTKNLIIDYFRTKKTVPLENGVYDGQDPRDNTTEENIQTGHLKKAIMQLRPDYQEIVILRFINQLSHKEIAKILKLSTGQTRILQYRALKKLREIISDE